MRFPLFATLFSLLFLIKGTNITATHLRYFEVAGGASNHNFLIETKQGPIFMRLSDQGAKTLENEYQCTLIAAEFSIAPGVVAYYPTKNMLLTRFLEGATPINIRENLPEVVAKIKELHALERPFPSAISPFELVHSLYDEATTLPVALTNIMPELVDFPYTAAPCHLDLHHGNILNDENELWIIDWEYSAQSDPLFDLAVLASTEEFTDQEMKKLLDEYGSDEWDHMQWMRLLADVRWAIWCFTQENQSSINYPFQEEGEGFLSEALQRLERLKDVSSSPSQ